MDTTNLDFKENDFEWALKNGAQIATPHHPDYPRVFQALDCRPQHLVFWGSPIWNSSIGLAVVGSRNPSSGALKWMEEVLPHALSSNAVLVSGAARGVDQQAHRISLRNNRPTIAFVPSGLAAIYPKEFSRWVRPIVDSGGAVVSVFHPYATVHKFHFAIRNRLIAAISNCTLVVEAKRKSGTSMTARLAMELGKSVCVMPTAAHDGFLGSLDLIYDGATMIRDGMDLRLAILDSCSHLL
jgi:DNA processing protein